MNPYNGRLLIIDDDANVCKFYAATLSANGFVVDTGYDLESMREYLNRHSYDGLLLDLRIGQEKGINGLPYVLKHAPHTKVLILTAHSTVENAVEAMQRGATSFLTKGMEPQAFVTEVKKHITISNDYRTSDDQSYANMGIIGDSPALKELLETIDKVKDVDSTVLVLGESGTGKELVARAIHKASKRKDRRFEAINCGAIPENLLESELFGHKRGSFTDAKADRKGIFEICDGGTLLLDEIGDMPISLQTKLLRVLQERQVTPIGASRPIDIDTRVVAATHRDILDEVKRHHFREDLYFRLSVVVIHIPPLRHRIEDLPILINHFLNQFNKRFDKNVNPPSKAVLTRLQSYDWPGNIRELQNAVERGVVLARENELDIKDMFQHLHSSHPERQNEASLVEKAFAMPLTDAKQFFEKEYVEHLLKEAKGNISEVARKSGRYRADIYRLMERYGFHQDNYR
ncbi:MAG: sigma-54-dependent transcriptional regulator [Oligoflexus sp.]